MASLFNENIPATASSIQSGELRDNFNALYDKLKTLEVRATSPESTSILIQGGPVYFRDGSLNTLKYIKFPTTEFDFLQNRGYISLRDSYGTVVRDLSSTLKGPRPIGNFRYLEVLVSLKSNGQLIFTESTTAQSSPLSSPFNIYYGDDEIPIALIFLDINSAGVLQPVNQTNITDVRPFVTTAFQNNIQIADLQETVEDFGSRIEALEPTTKITDNLLVRLVPLEKRILDTTTTTNTLVEVLSGQTMTPDGYLVRYAGGYVDFAYSATGDGNKRILDGNTDLAGLSANIFNRALITIAYNSSSSDSSDNATIAITHGAGTGGSSPDALNTVFPTIPTNHIPLAYVSYQMATGTSIHPLISDERISTKRIAWEFPITNLTASSIEVDMSNYLVGSDGSEADITNIYFKVSEHVELYDANSRPFRRMISTSTYNSSTKKLTLTVNDTFTGISLTRSPIARSVKYHRYVVEDLRPFIGR